MLFFLSELEEFFQVGESFLHLDIAFPLSLMVASGFLEDVVP